MKLARDPRQVGNIVRDTRKRKGWTQGELAERSGLRQATISNVENGSDPAKLQTLLAVLAALELEMQIGPRSTAGNTQ